MHHRFALFVSLSLLAAPAFANTDPPADVVATGEIGGEPDSFGWSAFSHGDVNGDGKLDLLVGAPTNDAVQDFAGRVYLFYGPFSGGLSPSDADARITTTTFGDNLGISVSCSGDLDDDGFDDVVVGARGNDVAGTQAGRVYIFYGPLSGNRAVGSADATISGSEFEEVGWAVAIPGDVNGDDRDDLLVGGPNSSVDGPTSAGRAYLFHGPINGSRTSASAEAIVRGELVDSQLGRSLAGAGDLNGDGLADLLLGSPKGPIGGSAPGRAYVFFSPITGLRNAVTADAILTGEFPLDLFGSSVAAGGDVNDDGSLDVLIGADDILGSSAGSAHVFYGPFDLTLAGGPRDPDVSIRGENGDDVFGCSVSSVGDLDGDGAHELIVGAWDNGAGGVRAGRAYVFENPVGRNFPAGDALITITGDLSGDCFGHHVAGAGDLDLDGRPDFLVGAPQFFDGDPGKVFIYHGGAFTTDSPELSLNSPALELRSIFPNPTNGSTEIRFSSVEANPARLSVFDAGGREVRRLFDGTLSAGVSVVEWDGRDDLGRAAGSGIYFVRLRSHGFTQTQQVSRVR